MLVLSKLWENYKQMQVNEEQMKCKQMLFKCPKNTDQMPSESQGVVHK